MHVNQYLAAIEQGADTEEHLCRACGQSYTCPSDMEPTPLCDLCAQTAVEVLAAEIIALREAKGYEQLRDALAGLPKTWYPDLTRAVVEAGYAAGTWVPDGAGKFVKSVEGKLGAANAKTSE